MSRFLIYRTADGAALRSCRNQPGDVDEGESWIPLPDGTAVPVIRVDPVTGSIVSRFTFQPVAVAGVLTVTVPGMMIIHPDNSIGWGPVELTLQSGVYRFHHPLYLSTQLVV